MESNGGDTRMPGIPEASGDERNAAGEVNRN